MKKERWGVLFLFVLASLKTIAFDKKINRIHVGSIYFETISTKDKLPNSIIYNIEQDSLGFLWLSSDDGLFRYDGQNFQIFTSTPNSLNSLTYNSFRDMHLDSSGNPWLLFPGVLDRLDTKSGKVKHYHSEKIQSRAPLMDAYKFIITPENNIYITSRNRGLFFLHHNDSSIQDLSQSKQVFPAISSQLEAIAYKNNCLYVGKKQKGIYRIYLNEDNSKILNVTKIADSNHKEILTIFPDKNNRLWVGTSQGIILINLTTGTTHNFESKLRNNQFLPESEVLSLFVDKENNLWIGTRENGLSIVSVPEIEAKAEQARGIRYSATNNDGSLSNRCINKIFEDNKGNIWLGTYSGGLQFAANYNKKIHSISFIPGHHESTSHPKVWGITEDHQGNIWIGTDGGGIDVWNPQKGIIKRLTQENGLSDNAILCATTDKEGKLWFGTYRGGINRIDPESGKIKIYKYLPSSFTGRYTSDIRIIYQSPSGKLWVGTNSNGLCYYEPENDSFVTVPELGSIDVRAILETSEENLWIGTHSNGLIQYNQNNKSKKIYRADEVSENSIPSNNINFIKEGELGRLWLGTEFGGLSCLDTKNEYFENYDTRDGLANSTVLSILKDSKGYFWLSTNVGISRFDPSEKSFINYNQENGVLPGEFLNSSCIASSSGTFYFGSSNGLNYFDPEFIEPSKVTPRVVFTDLKIFNKSTQPGEGVIEKNIEFNPVVHLNHKQSVFTVGFQAIQYPFANKCKYSYMLEGYDDQWSLAGLNNSATYRQLPPGTYSLKVKASNSDGIWSDDISSIQLEITPPFWKTIWAFFAYTIILVLISRFIFRFRMNQIETRNQLHYEQKIRQQEHQVHLERLEFFTNISHELRTPLTLVECAVDDLKNTLKNSRNKKVSESIKTASFHSSRLLELINQLLEFRRIETGNLQISAEKININAWLSSYLSNFKELADNKSILMKLSMPVKSIDLFVDPDKLSMIMNNLLSNAFKFTPDKGTIKIRSEENKHEVIIEVINSGLGISSKILPNIFERYFKTESRSTSTGIGLSLTKSLVELHKGKIKVASIPGKETRFTLAFPKGNKHFKPEQLKTIEGSKFERPDSLIDEKLNIPNKTDENKIMLIIEDNPDISSMLASKFSSGFEVKIAEDGEKGIEVAQKVIPDIIISDIMMPGIQGTEVCQILKNSNTTSHIPIILLTAKGTVEDELTGLTTGADDYISKPFNFKILEARVNALIQNRISLSSYFSVKEYNNKEYKIADIRQQQEHDFLQKAELLILDKYLHSDSSVFKLAEDLNFSRSSLYRKIKMLTGKSINEFVRSVKIKKAAQLLASEDITVSEAAYQVGFNDLKYFRESFIRQIGETPSALKKKSRLN